MSTVKINDVDPNAYKEWFKQAFQMVKRTPFMFAFLSLLPVLLILNVVNIFTVIIALSLFYVITMFFCSLKSDHNLTVSETLKGFDFKENSFFASFVKPYTMELVFFICFMALNMIFYYLAPNEADKPVENVTINILGLFWDFILALLIGVAYGVASIFKNFSIFFNNFFKCITYEEFTQLYQKEMFDKAEKSLIMLIVSRFVVFFNLGILINFKDMPLYSFITIVGIHFILAAFLTKVEYVAFRELFLGRGKNKEVEVKVNDVNTCSQGA